MIPSLRRTRATRWPAALVLSFGLTLGAAGTQTAAARPHVPGCAADASPGHTRQQLPDAEIFATDNTALITDPQDPRLATELGRFGCEVRALVRAGGGDPEESSLLDGVFWSSDLQAATYERSRSFDVDDVTPEELRAIAERVRTRYNQESVLVFDYLPASSPQATAVEVEVPGVDVTRLHDGLLADAEARDVLYGGSVTVRGGKLILVAERTDLPVVQRFVATLGGDWSKARVHYGAREFIG
ncbi:hypothetical protein [Yinghuangia soli]|uniref:Secreted protein n=1 Tax=Yinghuangia soli TaxID=2908204 RepID=A0AA41Q294_9ACTN|nr:hypothetical protein [Yinghuangia soli]MCF2530243.1 hypothetical protein [Yinghuangia soli]